MEHKKENSPKNNAPQSNNKVSVDAHKIADECGFTKEIELFLWSKSKRVRESKQKKNIVY